MLDEMPINCKGHVKIYSIEGSKKTLIADKPNAILPNALRVVAHSMANNVPGMLSHILVYDGVTLKATSDNFTLAPNAPNGGPYKAVYQSLFSDVSFAGNYDKLILTSNGVGDFSEFTLPTPLFKSSTQQILVTWTISFI